MNQLSTLIETLCSEGTYVRVFTEEKGIGTFVGAKLDKAVAKKLHDWAVDQGIPNVVKPEDMHVTICYTEDKPFDHKPAILNITARPNTFKLEMLGDAKEALVLRFDSPALERRHNSLLKKYGIKWKFPTYKPHVTLSYQAKGTDIKKIPEYDGNLTFHKEYTDSFDRREVDKKIKRVREWKEIVNDRRVKTTDKPKPPMDIIRDNLTKLGLVEVTRPLRGEMDSILSRAGYTWMGGGFNGEVFHKPGADYVLKVFNPKDRCYAKYVEFARKQTNPHFPRVIGKLIRINHDSLGIRLEPLKKLPNISPNQFMVESMRYYVKMLEYTGSERAVRNKLRMVFIDYVASKFSTQLNPATGSDADMIKAYEEMIGPTLVEALHLLVQFMNENNCGTDLKVDNVMMRGHTLVLSDPVY